MSYKPGDKVWVVVDEVHNTLTLGKHKGVVLSGPTVPYHLQQLVRFPGNWHEMDIEGYPTVGPKPWKSPASQLIPRHDPYEGDQKADDDFIVHLNKLLKPKETVK